MSCDESVFRVVYQVQGQKKILYARYISEESLMGFIEAEALLTAADKKDLPESLDIENLNAEFESVARTYLPMHAIIRIDELIKENEAMKSTENTSCNVSHFPSKKTSSDDGAKS